jgi:hypothetical protein
MFPLHEKINQQRIQNTNVPQKAPLGHEHVAERLGAEWQGTQNKNTLRSLWFQQFYMKYVAIINKISIQ